MSSSFSTSLSMEIEAGEHWLSPADLIAQLDIRPGMTVADIGAGPATYAVPIGRRVAPSGMVFAIEWRPWMMDTLRDRLVGSDVHEYVHLMPGRASETHLPSGWCHLVLLADIWHELEHHDAVLDEVRRILRPDGRLAILNWRPDGLCPPGPPLEHRISRRATLCSVELKSWTLRKAAEPGDEGYLLVFDMTDESVQS